MLAYVDSKYPKAEKVDFIVERKGHITKYIQQFQSSMAANLKELGQPGLSRLVGELIPAGKERVPLQAADVLCWHTVRYGSGRMDAADSRRYAIIAERDGHRWDMKTEQVRQMAGALAK